MNVNNSLYLLQNYIPAERRTKSANDFSITKSATTNLKTYPKKTNVRQWLQIDGYTTTLNGFAKLDNPILSVNVVDVNLIITAELNL